MRKINSVAVFCGSSNRVEKEFLEEAYKIGQLIARHNLHLVYGAGDCGLMGKAANGALDAGGTVTGVYPKILVGLESEHRGLTETIKVDDMHTRKINMFERADAFIILPGGFGTMDECFEVITWKQLHTHEKPIILYNFKNYWKHWKALTDQFIKKGFAHPKSRTLYDIVDKPEEIFKKLLG